MKQILLASFLAAAAMVPASAETMTIGSTAYEVTRNSRQIAPGVTYTELLFPTRTYTSYSGGSRVHVVEADLTNPTVKVELVNNGSMSGVKTLANHAKSVTKEGYKPVAGANGNFWITSEQPWKSQTPGWPHGACIRNGSMYTDPNVKTDPHCGGPAITGMLVVDENNKVYIDRVKEQLLWNGEGSGVAFRAIHVATGHELDLDKCNRTVNAGTASIYNKNYGTDRAFKPVDGTSSNTWEIVEGVCTELLLDLAPGEEWTVGGITKFIIKEKRENAGTGTLGNHDLAIVGRDSYATVMANGYNVGDEVNLSTVINFETAGTPKKVMQAVSGNVLAMKGGVKGDFTSYDTNSNERTLYATNAEGNKLWILVCEHNAAQTKTYFGFTTSQMCDIAKSFGATEATQVDCGGSAQMWADGAQVSRSYDSSGTRSVLNGLFVISTDTEWTAPTETPDDDPETPTGVTSYDLDVAYTDVEIPQLAGLTLKRVLAKGNYAYILAHDAAKTPTILVYDHVNNKVHRTLGTALCVNNDHTDNILSDIALTDDGYLLGIQRTNGYNYQQDNLYIYKWANDGEGVATGDAQHWNVTNANGNYTSNNSGESMAYYGTTTNGRLYYTARSSSAKKFRYCLLNINSAGQIASTKYNKEIANYDTDHMPVPMLYAAPNNIDHLIVNGTGVHPTEIVITPGSVVNATISTTMNLFDQSVAHTEIFKYDGNTYMIAPTATGVDLVDITEGLANAKKVTLNADALPSLATANFAAIGTKVVKGSQGSMAKAGAASKEMALLLVRDGKISKLNTKSEAVVDPDPEDPDPVEPDDPDPVDPVVYGDRANFAYDLAQEGDRSTGYKISYTLTGEAKEVKVNFINKDDNSVITLAGTTDKGVNTVDVTPDQLEGNKEYSWEIEVVSNPVQTSKQIFHEAPSKNDARGGVGIVTNPESDAYGRVVTAIGYAQGFGLYTPQLDKVGTYHAGFSTWTATNRSDLYRLGMRDGAVAYASAFSDKGAGFWKFDPTNPTAAPTNLSAGTNDGKGCITYNGEVTGTGSSAVAFEGMGENTKVWTFAEDWPTGNSSYKGIICRWDIGNAEQITTGVNAAYANLSGHTYDDDGTKHDQLLASENVNITPYADGVFISQGRTVGMNAAGCPCFIYTDIYGKPLYNSASDVDIIPSCGGGMAITADGSLIAVSGYRNSNIRLYDVTWDGKVPSLTLRGEIENSAVTASNSETSQLAFDPAGNLYSWCRSSSATESGLHVYSLASTEPTTAVTPAKSSFAVLGPIEAGVENVSVNNPAEAPVEWYTLQGVRVSGENLAPGIYVRRQGKLTKKVYVK